MNKKTLNIILVVLMAVIWGLVGSRLFLNANATTTNASNTIIQPTTTYKALAKDTFQLEYLERDPFLGNVGKYNISPSNTANKKSVKGANKKGSVAIKWPAVSYFGLVKKASNKQPLALLKVNNKTQYVKAKDVIEEIKILKITRDSIALQFQNEKKYIKKQ